MFSSTVVSCPPLTPLPNTTLVSYEGNMFNQTVVFRCVEDFMPSNFDIAFELTCTSSGVWSSDLPSCIPGILQWNFGLEPLYKGHSKLNFAV